MKVPKYINFEIIDIIEKCKNAFSKTIKVDKTINVEAFVDNLACEFNNLKVF